MKQIDFIHIPKNCGTSITQMVKAHHLSNITIRHHGYDPKRSDPEKTMYVLRNPIERFVSAFYYSRIYKNYILTTRTDIVTPSDLVKLLIQDRKNEELLFNDFHRIGNKFLGISWVWAPQHLWDNGAKYVLFHENIQEDISLFLNKIDCPQVPMPQVNKSKKECFGFEDAEIEYLQHRYERDFALIAHNACQQWKDD